MAMSNLLKTIGLWIVNDWHRSVAAWNYDAWPRALKPHHRLMIKLAWGNRPYRGPVQYWLGVLRVQVGVLLVFGINYVWFLFYTGRLPLNPV
jgi:hypothetical protein